MTEMKKLRQKLRKRYLWSAKNSWQILMHKISKSEAYCIYRFILHLKKYEHVLKKKTTPITYILRRYHLTKYSQYAQQCGFTIGDGVLGEDIVFYHRANIVINPAAKVGDGCRFHGNCCIGVAHTGEMSAPVLGKNVEIGFGAVILGDVYIADNITIGANSVVTKSFYTPGITIAGVPAREIKKTTES